MILHKLTRMHDPILQLLDEYKHSHFEWPFFIINDRFEYLADEVEDLLNVDDVPGGLPRDFIILLDPWLFMVLVDEKLFSHVIIALNCTFSHRELRRELTDGIKVELSIDLPRNILHHVNIIKLSQIPQYFGDPEAVVIGVA